MSGYEELFARFSTINVLIVGDVMVDSYVWGKVDRISPEAPVPVVSVEGKEHRLGGAANVALNLKSLGAKPLLCSLIGSDDTGIIFAQLLKQQGMETSGLIIDPGRKTTSKTRIISGTQHCLRIDDEMSHPISHQQETQLVDRVKDYIDTGNVHAVIFEDYDKGTVTPRVIQEVIALANKRRIPVAVDPKRRNFNYYKGATLFKPNFKELCEGMNVEVRKSDFESIHSVVGQFQELMNIRHVMVTLSELGVIITDGKAYTHVPAHVREVADVSGAGDTVISVATLCMACGIDAPSIARISNMAGGLVCEHKGVVPVDKTRLLTELQK